MSKNRKSFLLTLLLAGGSTQLVSADENPAKAKALIAPMDSTVGVPVSLDGSVINFPSNPERLILGRKSAFSVETIGSDLAISPLNANGTSSLFVYVMGRRYSFRLRAASVPSSVFIVKDPIPRPLQTVSGRK